MAELARRGVMMVLASPSGAGKSSISRAIFEQDPNISLSVSVTTRARRTDEIEGKHYHFIDVPTFERMRDEGELLESAEVHGNFYGTPRARVEEKLSAGRDILFDIDYQGTLQLLEECPRGHGDDLHPAALDHGAAQAPRTARAGQQGHHREAAQERPHRDGALRTSTTTFSSIETSKSCGAEGRTILAPRA